MNEPRKISIALPDSLERQIRAHGEQVFPHECCGILAGRLDGETRVVTETRPLTNLRETEGAQEFIETRAGESAANRYLVDPREQMRVERELDRRGLTLLGFYHSHPNCPARPSQYDTDHAWPFYIYLIVSVRDGKSSELLAWQLREDRSAFEEVALQNLHPKSDPTPRSSRK